MHWYKDITTMLMIDSKYTLSSNVNVSQSDVKTAKIITFNYA